MVLDIVEVSRKQAYIFSSNKLKDNVERSAQIARVTGSAFFEKYCGNEYSAQENLVYSGGGHTVLCFDDEEKAKAFNRTLTRIVLENYPEMEMFVKLHPYDKEKSPGENLKELTKALEKKKSIRRASFRHGTFGFEEVDRNTFEPVRVKIREHDRDAIAQMEGNVDKELLPDGFKSVKEFKELGGSFIAVVHIDGNGMGARVKKLYQKLEADNLSWDQFRKKIREFSEAVDADYKMAYKEMLDTIVDSSTIKELTAEDKHLPVRRIILSGDDVCFVSDGRIGIETARIYIEKLSEKINAVDGGKYAACAGVSVVHAKYPFFMAYELAESLCKNAKLFGAKISPADNGNSVSSIDWHLAYGELQDNLEEEREEYRSVDGNLLCARPYIIKSEVDTGCLRSYDDFKKVLKKIMSTDDAAARGRIKALRNVLKQADDEIRYYRDFYNLQQLMETDYSILFDAIETMDTFISIS